MNPIERHIFNIDIPTSSPTVGSLLISEPFLKDEHFHHSVISIVDYEPGISSMGVVLNRPTSHYLNNLIEGVSTRVKVPIYCGGPMSYDRLFFLHTLGDIISRARMISDGLYVGGDFDEILRYINAGYPIEGNVRFFLGYSGWSPGQLEQEVNDHVWAVTTTTSPAELLTDSDDSYWHRYVRRLGDSYKGWRLHPRNPQSN